MKNNYIRIFKFMNHKLVYLLGLITTALLNMLFQILISKMFQLMFNSIEKNDFTAMLTTVIRFVVIIIVIFAVMPIFVYLAQKVATETTGTIRKAVFNQLTKLPMPFFKQHHSGDITSRMTTDFIEMEKAYKEYFIHFTSNIITGIGTTLFMFFIDWRLASIAIAGGVITVIINTVFSKRLRIISEEVLEQLAKVNEKLSNIIAGMNVIRVFNLSDVILNKFFHANQDVLKTSYKRVSHQAFIDALNSLVSIISFVGIATYGAYLIIIGEAFIGDIVAIVQLQNGVSMLVNSLGTFISQNQASIAAASRVFMILDQPKEPSTHQTDSKDGYGQDIIEFSNVDFAYDNQCLLHHLSFQVEKNKVYALVGASGSGKSTIFKLILQFYPPSSGTIQIADQTTIKNIRDYIAYVPQDAFLFSGTVKENIRNGCLDATDNEIIEAAKLAYAHDFIENFEQGYDTEVLENGAKLSGGQRQRIAIARAFLKNAPILLLDEATSSLDSESEKLIQASLSNLMRNRTTMIIAHRLSTVKNADQILVLDQGAIVERGTHDELMLLNEVYANLYNKQFI